MAKSKKTLPILGLVIGACSPVILVAVIIGCLSGCDDYAEPLLAIVAYGGAALYGVSLAWLVMLWNRSGISAGRIVLYTILILAISPIVWFWLTELF